MRLAVDLEQRKPLSENAVNLIIEAINKHLKSQSFRNGSWRRRRLGTPDEVLRSWLAQVNLAPLFPDFPHLRS